MNYISTRGQAPAAQFETVLLSGLAPDGGLFLPADWPQMREDVSGMSFSTAAARIIEPFVTPWIGRDGLEKMTASAFSSYDHADVAPLVQIDDQDYSPTKPRFRRSPRGSTAASSIPTSSIMPR